MRGVSKPARRLLSGAISNTRTQTQCCRQFHITSSLPVRPKAPSSTELANPPSEGLSVLSRRTTESVLKPYDEDEKEAMKELYSSEQRAIIEAGEESIDLNDLSNARFRMDHGRIEYLDDFTKIQPTIDSKVKPTKIDPDLLKPAFGKEGIYKAEEREVARRRKGVQSRLQALEMAALDAGFLSRQEQWETECEKKGLDPNETPDPLKQQLLLKSEYGFLDEYGSPFVAPAIPKMEELQVKQKNVEEKDPEGKQDRLKKVTGMTLQNIFDLKTKVLVSHRVVNQTRLGKIQSIYCLAIAGNGQGMLGIGEGKATEADEAMDKARYQAMTAMKPIPRYEDRTIYGEVESKVSATVVKLMSRPPGFGLRCQHNIFEMARAAGISDLSAKVPRSRNKMNTVKAAYQALMSQRIPDEIAIGRGKKMVDVRKVYYGGNQALPQWWHEFNKSELRRRDQRRQGGD